MPPIGKHMLLKGRPVDFAPRRAIASLLGTQTGPKPLLQSLHILSGGAAPPCPPDFTMLSPRGESHAGYHSCEVSNMWGHADVRHQHPYGAHKHQMIMHSLKNFVNKRSLQTTVNTSLYDLFRPFPQALITSCINPTWSPRATAQKYWQYQSIPHRTA